MGSDINFSDLSLNNISFDTVAQKYMPLIISRAKYFSRYDIEFEELVQEGLMGLYNAFKNFCPSKQVSFSTFATHCINNKMLSLIRAFSAKKSFPLRNYVSLDDDQNENIIPYNNLLNTDPQEIYANFHDKQNMLKAIIKVLSKYEKNVIDLYLLGYSYDEIAIILHTSSKSIDNAIQRIKKKYRNLSINSVD